MRETCDESPENVVRLPEAGRERLDTDDEEFDATVDATVPHPSFSASTARENGALIERLDDPGSNDLLISTPHGGDIEPFTDEQGARLHSQLEIETTYWRCRGWNDDGSAFERWHIPTHDISPASFPKLGEIADRSFDRSGSFQGISTDDVRIGGGAPRSLKRRVVDAISETLPDDIEVSVATEEYQVRTEDTLVNAIGDDEGSFWVGQSLEARRNHWREIADATANVLREL